MAVAPYEFSVRTVGNDGSATGTDSNDGETVNGFVHAIQLKYGSGQPQDTRVVMTVNKPCDTVLDITGNVDKIYYPRRRVCLNNGSGATLTENRLDKFVSHSTVTFSVYESNAAAVAVEATLWVEL